MINVINRWHHTFLTFFQYPCPYFIPFLTLFLHLFLLFLLFTINRPIFIDYECLMLVRTIVLHHHLIIPFLPIFTFLLQFHLFQSLLVFQFQQFLRVQLIEFYIIFEFWVFQKKVVHFIFQQLDVIIGFGCFVFLQLF